MGTIKIIGGEMPHPQGKVSVDYKTEDGHFSAKIILPLKTTGTFIWKGKNYILKEGINNLKI